VLRNPLGLSRLPAAALVVGAGVLLSGCAIGFRVPATDITATGATLNGYVGSDRTEQGEWWFKYGKTSDYGSETPKRAIAFTELTRHDVTEPLTGLEPSTDYHYVLCADDQEPGVGEFCSAPQAFRTFADATSDSVVVMGNGSFSNIDIDVSSGPSGENPTGHVAADVPPYGRLTSSAISCLSVTGATANVAGTLEPNSAGVTDFRVTVVDNGPADSGLDGFAGGPGSVAAGCAVTQSTIPLSSGDAVVIDAPAP
jgi:hypothetical protein